VADLRTAAVIGADDAGNEIAPDHIHVGKPNGRNLVDTIEQPHSLF
jgi:hypothetical protein